MTVQWFRFYTDAMRHPKVASMTDQQFRLWVELLCVASERDGHIPEPRILKHILRRRLDHLLVGLEWLIRAELIDPLEDGYKPHGWDKRQYKSDSSTERSRKHREKRNVAATPPETEADTESEKKEPNGSCASSAAPSLTIEEVVEDWNVMANQLGLPVVKKITPARRKAFRGRLLEYPDLQDWQDAFRCVRNAPWMHGKNDRNWKADFDFLLQAKSFTRLTEDAYGKA